MKCRNVLSTCLSDAIRLPVRTEDAGNTSSYRSMRGYGVHMHEYDENWLCKCGCRLITEFDPQTRNLIVKACVTPEGETVLIDEKNRETARQKARSRDVS